MVVAGFGDLVALVAGGCAQVESRRRARLYRLGLFSGVPLPSAPTGEPGGVPRAQPSRGEARLRAYLSRAGLPGAGEGHAHPPVRPEECTVADP